MTVGLASEVEPPEGSLHRVPSPPLSRTRPSPRSAPRLSATGFEASLRQRLATITEYAQRREQLVRDLVGSWRDDQVECQVDRHDRLVRLVLRGADRLDDDQLATLIATGYAQARDDVRRQIADLDERYLS